MKYGYFDDKNREYVITTPATPVPWINYLGNNGFYSLVSNTAGGYIFYQDAKLRRLTRYRYNNVPSDLGGRYYYIKDGDTVFNPSFLPTMTTLDEFKCRHGLGYTIFESKKNGIKSELTLFIPQEDSVEINQLVIKNTTDQVKNITVFSFVEWCLWNAVDDHTNFQRNLNIGEVEIDEHTIYHKTEYRERRNHFAFYFMNEKHHGFDSDRDAFLGKFRSFSQPIVVEKGKSKNSIASGNAPIGSHRYQMTLQPGESRKLIYLIGYVENDEDHKFIAPNIINKEKVTKLINMYGNEKGVKQALYEVKTYWHNLLSRFQVKTVDEKLDRMVNIWNQYQCMVTFNMSRSASYYESGTGRGMGFRDSCQDLFGFVHLVPSRARQRILDIAAIQSKDGSTYHQYQPLTKRGNADVGSGFNDDPLWLVAGVASYLKETGDISILNEPVPYDNQIGSEEPLFNHLRASMHYTMNHLGPHGLPLIGRADWNDCLNLNCFSKTPGESFQTTDNFDNGKAESIFIAAMYQYYGKDYIKIAELFGDSSEVKFTQNAIKQLESAVLQHGWDGKWYLRAYDSFSHKVGSHECEEGKIYIESQAFCSLARIGEAQNFPTIALESGLKYLLGDYGVELLAPAYTKYHLELGEISSYPPGNKENGSIFCHTNPWYVIALTQVGMLEEAYDLYQRFTPSYLEDVSDIHETEPYVYSQTIAGRQSTHYGRAKNSWLTGTASWSFVAITQGILGIIPTFDGLLIDPKLPASIEMVHVTRVFRNTTYDIHIQQVGLEHPQLSVDGVDIAGQVVPLNGQDRHQVVYRY